MQETQVKIRQLLLYKHVPKLVETSHECEVTTLWNKQVQTDRTIPNSKANITIHDNEEINFYIRKFQETEM